MALPQELYDAYKSLRGCELVRERRFTDKTIEEFQTFLNLAQPHNGHSVETKSRLNINRELIRNIYKFNPMAFTNYISTPANRVPCLILWTESQKIVEHFGLKRFIHIGWDGDEKRYIVSKYITREYNVRNQKQSGSRSFLPGRKIRTSFDHGDDKKKHSPSKKTEEINLSHIENISGMSWADIALAAEEASKSNNNSPNSETRKPADKKVGVDKETNVNKKINVDKETNVNKKVNVDKETNVNKKVNVDKKTSTEDK